MVLVLLGAVLTLLLILEGLLLYDYYLERRCHRSQANHVEEPEREAELVALPQSLNDQNSKDRLQQDPIPDQEELLKELNALFCFPQQDFSAGLFRSWWQGFRLRWGMRQEQKTARVQILTDQLSARRDIVWSRAMKARVKRLATMVSTGLVSERTLKGFRAHFPGLLEQSLNYETLRRLEQDLKRERLHTLIAEEQAERGKLGQQESAPADPYWREIQKSIRRVVTELRGRAAGTQELLQELNRIKSEIDQDSKLEGHEQEFLKATIEQQFRNLAATWGRRR